MDRLDVPQRGKRVIPARDKIDGQMSELGLAVRGRRIGDTEQMTAGANHRAITFSAGEGRNGYAINRNAQTDLVTEVCLTKNGQSAIAHQLTSRIIVTTTSRYHCRDGEIHRREKKNDQLAD